MAPTSPQRTELTDLAMELASGSAALRSALPEGIVSALATLMRAMDCYYSNLIEGHDTHPIEIERALKDDFSREPQKRDLQLEARAHIAVQAWIDAGGLSSSPTSQASLIEIHRGFFAAFQPELLEAEDPDTGERVAVTPGGFRKRDVRVGRHVPVSPGAIPRFLERLEAGYARLGRQAAPVAQPGGLREAATFPKRHARHWIAPGRVAFGSLQR